MNSNNGYKIRCLSCGTRNRIPSNKAGDVARCGSCKSILNTEVISATQPVVVTDNDFEQQVVKSPLPVLVFFWAPWCSSCQAVTPIIDEFASEARGHVKVCKVNVDASPMTASKFNILSVPNLLVFDNGQFKESLFGLTQKHDIMVKMAPYI